jgi:hypothetical protein
MTNQMRLYQHSAGCPVALRSFLDCNPIYWFFIPQLWHEAISENIVYLRERERETKTSNPTDPELDSVVMMGAMDNQRVARCFEYLPSPPAVYTFSYRQRQDQRLFFENFFSSSMQQLPYSSLDLYKMPVIVICKKINFNCF